MKYRSARTDMAREIYEDEWDSIILRDDEIKFSGGGFRIEEILVDEDGGRYVTLTSSKLLSKLTIGESLLLAEVLAKELRALCGRSARVTVVGIGNRDMTVDSLGVRTAEFVSPLADEPSLTVMIPGTEAATGIPTFESVKAIAACIAPSTVIAVDALAARDPLRLGSSVQLSNLGITPGAGLGRRSGGLSRKTLGIPVISIGVPTVIASDILTGKTDDEDSTAERYYVALSETDAVVDNAARIIARAIEKAFEKKDYN